MFDSTRHNAWGIFTDGKFKPLSESNPLMIFIVSQDGIIVEVNKRVTQHLGYVPKELVGTHIEEVFHPEDRDYATKNLRDCLLNNKQSYTQELRKIAKDGTVVYVKELISTVLTASQERELLIIGENVTGKAQSLCINDNEEEYKLLTEKTSDIVILHNLDGRIRYCNKAAMSISLYSSEEIKRVNVHTLFDDSYFANVEKCLNSSARMHGFIYEANLIRKDYTEIPIEINISRLTKGGESEDILVVARDIRERKEKELKIKQYNTELKEANLAKDKFFSILAHDLKGPFNALLGYSDLLLSEFEEMERSEIKEYVTHMHNVTQNVYDLLNNLLNWSRIQTNSIYCEPREFNICDTIKKASRLYNDIASEKSIVINICADNATEVYGDENMVYTVIRNLLSNALKFTDRDGEIKVVLESINDCVQITIVDNGLGMSEDDVKKLFKLDVNYSTLGTRKETGTGLGLILSKELIEKNNGTLLVSSKLGEGSSFSFTLPVSKPL